MKFQLTFKMPDVLDQIEFRAPEDTEKAKKLAEKYVRMGEYITVEFDTDAETAVVLP